jgi:uncharacterized membrane protein
MSCNTSKKILAGLLLSAASIVSFANVVTGDAKLGAQPIKVAMASKPMSSTALRAISTKAERAPQSSNQWALVGVGFLLIVSISHRRLNRLQD